MCWWVIERDPSFCEGNNTLKLDIRKRFLTISLQTGEVRIEKNDKKTKHF